MRTRLQGPEAVAEAQEDDDIASSAASSPRSPETYPTPEVTPRADAGRIESTSTQKAESSDVKSAERTVVGKASAFSERSCWVLLGTIIGVWGQLDLWDDVDSMLRGLPAT